MLGYTSWRKQEGMERMEKEVEEKKKTSKKILTQGTKRDPNK